MARLFINNTGAFLALAHAIDHLPSDSSNVARKSPNWKVMRKLERRLLADLSLSRQRGAPMSTLDPIRSESRLDC
jgi:hypothetical protein